MKNFRSNHDKHSTCSIIVIICLFLYLNLIFPKLGDAHSVLELTEIKHFAYSSDGNRLAIAAHDEIWLFDAITYEKRLTIEDNTHPFGGWYNHVVFSPDGSIVASVNNRNDEIQLWNPINGENLLSIHEPAEYITSIRFSPDGKRIASEGSDKNIRLWDVHTGQLIKTLKIDLGSSFTFSPDGNTIATAGYQKVHLWDAHTGQLIKTFNGHTDFVFSVAFSPDGKILASSGFQEILLWDPHTGHKLNTLAGHRGCVESLAFSPDGLTLAGGSYQEILLWDVSEAKHLNTLSLRNIFTAGVTKIVFSPDGKKIASMSDSYWNRIIIWDVETGKYNLMIKDDRIYNSTPIKFSPDVNTVTYIVEDSLSGWQYVFVSMQLPIEQLVSGKTNIGKIQRKGTKLSKVHETPVYYQSPVKSTFFSLDGKTTVSIGNNEIALWDTDSGKHRVTIKDEFKQIYSVALSPDGKTLASGNGWNNNQIRLWNAINGNLISILNGHTSWIDELEFSPDGKTLFSASRDSTVRLWDIKTGEHKGTLKEHTAGVHTIEFSPNGELLASACQDNTIMLWEVSSTLLNDKPKATYVGHTDKINQIKFSPNGNTLASASWDHTIKLWNIDTEKTETLKGHLARIDYLEFSKDGNTLISGSWDETIRLWDTNSGTLRTILQKSRERNSQIVLSPDGKALVSKENYNSLHLWDLNTGKLQTSFNGGDFEAYEFLPGGESLISTEHPLGGVHVWNIETGKLQRKVETRQR